MVKMAGTKDKKPEKKPKTGTPSNTSVCVVCHEEKTGHVVRDDLLIRSIRAVKNFLHIAANNRLVVCKGCVEKHRAKRADFEKKLALYGGGGLLIIIIFTLISRTLQGFAVSLLLGLFVAALALFSYHPASEAK